MHGGYGVKQGAFCGAQRTPQNAYRKLNRQRSVFPSDTALLKALYLATFEATKKWTLPIRNWGQVNIPLQKVLPQLSVSPASHIS